jgi:hypothetical protein
MMMKMTNSVIPEMTCHDDEDEKQPRTTDENMHK